MKRRDFLILLASAGGLVMAGKGWAMGIFDRKKEDKKAKAFPYTLDEAAWKKKLTSEQYKVLREHSTERAFTSSLNDEKRKGIFHCAGCEWPLFSMDHKFDSGTGWPSFWQPLNDKAVGTTTDYVLLYPRTEVHCANCGGHLGHVFDDGPQPTGKRYCMNGVAMVFRPST